MIIWDDPFSSNPVPHCCLFCGWVPIERMTKYLEIHGDDAECISCHRKLPHKPPYIDPYSY